MGVGVKYCVGVESPTECVRSEGKTEDKVRPGKVNVQDTGLRRRVEVY